MPIWPKQSDVLAGNSVYGNPKGRTGGVPSREWETTDLVLIPAPWPMQMGDIKITRLRVHKHCAASLTRVLAAIKVAANSELRILREWGVTNYGGGYNFRLMRGGSKLSMHSYGCAIDLDPANNGLGDSTPRFANYPKVLKAFENEGWEWGGRWSRADGMHWQATQGFQS